MQTEIEGRRAGFASSALADRKRAVHAIASPGLVVTCVTGYFQTLFGVALNEIRLRSAPFALERVLATEIADSGSDRSVT